MYRYVQNRVLMYLKLLMATSDFLCLNALLSLTLFLCSQWGILTLNVNDPTILISLFVTYNMSWCLAAMASGAYTDSQIEYLESVFRSSGRMFVVFFLTYCFAVFLISRFGGSLGFLSILAGILFGYAVVSRFVLTYVYNVLPRRMGWTKDVFLIGHQDYMEGVMASFPTKHPFYTINTIPYFDNMDSLAAKEEKVRQFKRYFEEVSRRGIHEVFLINSPDVLAHSQDIINEANFQCVALNFVSTSRSNEDLVAVGKRKAQDVLVMDLPVLRSHENSLNGMNNRFKKRLLDLFISGCVIIFILSWMIPLIGLIIKLQSPGPIFFRQARSGRNNQTFNCLKFRSMVVNKDSDAKQASKGDKRITPIGQFLRKTSLDEFPQFINVFLGQMSIVGPRPHMLSHTEHYSKLIKQYMVRHYVKPGITGWAQVNGYRGETNVPGLMAKRVEYDLEYMNNWSLGLDIKIIFMTAFNMAKGEKNAY